MKLVRISLLIVSLIALTAGIQWYAKKFRAARPWLTEEKIRKIASDPERFPAYANCPFVWEGTLEIDGIARAHASHAGNPGRVVETQLKYLNGYFNHDPAASSKFRVHMRPGVKFQIRSQKKISYGRDLAIDRIVEWDGVQNGKVKAADRALEISYHASQPIAICSSVPQRPEQIQIKLPYDPDLAFWLTPQSSRRLLKFEGDASSTTPCAFEEMADLKSPTMYWYVWNPDASGKDVDGRSFDCHDILKPGVDYQVRDAKFVQRKLDANEVDYHFLKSAEPLRLDFYFGVMTQNHKPSDISDALQALKSKRTILEAADEILEADSKNPSKLDPGFVGMLYFVRLLNQYVPVGHSQIEEHDGYFNVRMPILLKRSGQKAELTLYFGPTDQNQKVTQHWTPLLKSFETADVVFYVGHAGMGANLSLSELQKTLGLKSADLKSSATRKKYQLFGIVSCYGSAFYGDDYAELRREPGLVTDVLLTASNRYLVGLPVSLLYYLDLSLSGVPVSLSKTLGLSLPAGDTAFIHRYQ